MSDQPADSDQTTIRVGVLLTTAPPPGDAGEEGPFIKVEGREVLLRCSELFVNHDEVAQLLVAFTKEQDEEGRRRFGGHLAFSGVKLAPAADDWQGQLASMAGKLDEGVTHVLVHDAARPAVGYTDLDGLFEAVREEPAKPVALAAPVGGTIVEVDGKGHPVGERPAEAFRLLLWPRVYPREAFDRLAGEGRLEIASHRLVEALPYNVRVRGGGDAKLCRSMLNLLPQRKKEGPLSPFEEAQW